MPGLLTRFALAFFQNLVVKWAALAHLFVKPLSLLLVNRLHHFVALFQRGQVGVCGALQRLLLRCNVIIRVHGVVSLSVKRALELRLWLLDRGSVGSHLTVAIGRAVGALLCPLFRALGAFLGRAQRASAFRSRRGSEALL